MTYGERYDNLMSVAQAHLDAAKDVSRDGDLWNAHTHLANAENSITAAMDLIQEASKVAFERVFKERV
jgi:hypothetical protein